MALHCLGLAGYTIYLPRITERVVRRGRKVDVHQSLFPCYAFVLVVDHCWSASRCPGVIRLIMDGTQPARVPDSVIDDLRRRECNGYIHLPKPPGLQRGDRVYVRRGPLEGLHGLYAGQSGRERVAVLFSLLNGQRRVAIEMS